MPNQQRIEPKQEKPPKGLIGRMIAWLIKGAEKDAAARVACST